MLLCDDICSIFATMIHIRTIAIVLLMSLLHTQHANAQRHELLSDQVRSLQVIANNKWMAMPVIELNHGTIDISFDDLTHEYHRYMYRLEHCEANWEPSEQLFDSEFCQGFASGNTIDDVTESVLTNVLYTHYHLQLPNNQCRMTMSGNYKLTVYDDNHDEEPILTACFMVVESRMGIGLSVTTNTDLDINQKHQQVAMELRYSGIQVTNPAEQLKTVVLQNQRWDDARWNAKPQYVMPDRLQWEHCRDYIFDAGNEYRKFEILSTDVASMGIEHLGWDGEQFHAYPFVALPRPNYLYDEDANGAFLLRNSDNFEAEFTSDYMLVHFQLKTNEPLPYEVYVNGQWTYDRFTADYRMHYDDEARLYEAVIPLKLGYYSFQYVMLDTTGRVLPVPSEGNFYQTENTYQALVYYREPGGRTDRLVGYQSTTNQ